jgi:hypothetical protein
VPAFARMIVRGLSDVQSACDAGRRLMPHSAEKEATRRFFTCAIKHGAHPIGQPRTNACLPASA